MYKNDDVDDIIAYEHGELDHDATLALFQRLVDSGLVWNLQGSYGRTATRFIEAGLVTDRPQVRDDLGLPETTFRVRQGGAK